MFLQCVLCSRRLVRPQDSNQLSFGQRCAKIVLARQRIFQVLQSRCRIIIRRIKLIRSFQNPRYCPRVHFGGLLYRRSRHSPLCLTLTFCLVPTQASSHHTSIRDVVSTHNYGHFFFDIKVQARFCEAKLHGDLIYSFKKFEILNSLAEFLRW